MADDRRQHDRYRFWIPAEVVVDERRVPAVGHDMSRRGAMVVCQRHVEVGVHLELRFQMPPGEGEARSVAAVVRRSGKNTADPSGLWPFELGLEFQQDQPSLEGELHELLAKLTTRSR